MSIGSIFGYLYSGNQTLRMNNLIVKNSIAGGAGGSIYFGLVTSITNSLIQNSTCNTGGGMYQATGGVLTMSNTTITQTRTSGGLYLTGNSMVSNCTFTNNKAPGFYITSTGGDPNFNVTVASSDIEDLSVSSGIHVNIHDCIPLPLYASFLFLKSHRYYQRNVRQFLDHRYDQYSTHQ